MNKITILAISAVFVASILAISAFEVEGVKPQAQAQGVFVFGNGPIQTFTCPDMSTPGIFANPTRFTFVKGETSFGRYDTSIDATNISGLEIRVIWGNAEINANDYKLIGTVGDIDLDICPSSVNVPSLVILEGDCSLGGTSTLTIEGGFVAELNTDVVCG